MQPLAHLTAIRIDGGMQIGIFKPAFDARPRCELHTGRNAQRHRKVVSITVDTRCEGTGSRIIRQPFDRVAVIGTDIRSESRIDLVHIGQGGDIGRRIQTDIRSPAVGSGACPEAEGDAGALPLDLLGKGEEGVDGIGREIPGRGRGDGGGRVGAGDRFLRFARNDRRIARNDRRVVRNDRGIIRADRGIARNGRRIALDDRRDVQRDRGPAEGKECIFRNSSRFFKDRCRFLRNGRGDFRNSWSGGLAGKVPEKKGGNGQ